MENWRTAAPEALGMDSRPLAALLDAAHGQAVHSLIVLRNGVCLLEAYWHPHHREALHDQRSVAKSITALVVGLAAGRGLIGVERRALDFFPGRVIANRDERKNRIQVGHLLNMSSGLELTDADTGHMLNSPDWAQFVLDRPMAAEPGTRFQYATGGVHLLSALFTQAAGQSLLACAQERLFTPLGISDVRWLADPQGHTAGGMMLFLRPRDMVKLGQLMLDGGIWQGRTILAPDWVRAAASPQGPPDASRDGYGYLWWMRPGLFYAAGYAGQAIFVAPAQRLVVAFTGGLAGAAADLPHEWMRRYILPAVVSAAPLPENPAAADLDAKIRALAAPDPSPVPPHPAAAAQVAGRLYTLDENIFGWRTLSFAFPPGVAQIQVNGAEGLPVGLDGLFRVTPGGRFIHWLPQTFPVALKGGWENDRTFTVHYQELGVPEPHRIAFTFDENRLDVLAVETLNDDVTRFGGNAL